MEPPICEALNVKAKPTTVFLCITMLIKTGTQNMKVYLQGKPVRNAPNQSALKQRNCFQHTFCSSSLHLSAESQLMVLNQLCQNFVWPCLSDLPEPFNFSWIVSPSCLTFYCLDSIYITCSFTTVNIRRVVQDMELLV